MSSQESHSPIKVFISYAHEDQDFLAKLKTHLSPLERSGKIFIWHDQEITAGDQWNSKIETHLNDADIILLLISADFFHSKYCWENEVKNALKQYKDGKTRVIPIILKPVDWEDTSLGELQALPTGAKPVTSMSWASQDDAFENVAQGIRKVLEGKPLEEESAFKKIFRRVTDTLAKGITKTSHPFGWSKKLLLIGCLLLVVYCVDVVLGLFNIPSPFWVSSLALCLALLCDALLLREAFRESTSVKVEGRRAFLALSAATLGLLTVGNFLERKEPLSQLRVGLPTGNLNPSKTRPFENTVSDILGIPVSSTFKSTYQDLITTLGSRDVEIAWLGPLSYLYARQLYNAKTIVCNKNLQGEKFYYSYIVANAKANIHGLDDLKGKNFALADVKSTSGRLIPLYELKKAGFNLDKDIQTSYVGAGKVLDNVLSGEYPAGAISSDDYDNALSHGRFNKNELIIVKKISDRIPQGPFVARHDIQQEDKLRIEDAFSTVEDTELSIIKTLGIGGFAKIEDNSYDFLIPIVNDLGFSLSDIV